MKKLKAFMVVLMFAVGLAGCGQGADSGGAVSICIGDSVTRVDITHYISGKSVQWVAEGQEVDDLRAWASELEYKSFQYKEGQSPGDGDGGEVYNFSLMGGDFLGFSYVINGSDDCYLLMEGNWYSVSNPSDPPVAEP